jgi:Asp-tRNA(Asn)/Glu-tRNA(Gln) amidotransferase C subunit
MLFIKINKIFKDQLDQEVIHEIQEGLQGIQRARLSLQQVFQQSPGCFSDDEINQLVSTVHEKIVNIINLIEKIQNSEMNLKVSASVNKLRSDVLKEQQAIIAATEKVPLIFFKKCYS